MAYKSGYEPKDARTISTYEDDDDFDDFDDWSLDSTPRRTKKRVTGTQALIEFLNTTSPEEFKKAPPPPTTTTKKTTPFFLRKKNKNKSSNGNSSSKSSESSTYNALPNIIHRKNYIEIIPHNGSRLPHFYEPMSGSIPALNTGSKPSLNEPVLPSRRDSSLYAASIRSLSIKSPSKSQHNNNNSSNHHHHHHHSNSNNSNNHHPIVSRSNSTKTSNSGNYHNHSLQRTPSSEINNHTLGTSSKTIVSPPSPNLKTILSSSSSANSSQTSLLLKEREKNKKMVDAMITAYEGMDVIEAGLIQRLKQCELIDEKIPSDAVSTVLAEEHIRALKVSSNAERLYQQQLLDLQQYQQSQLQVDLQYQPPKNKKKVRHVQVQTLPWNEKDDQSSSSLSVSSEIINKNTTSISVSTNTMNNQQEQPPSLSPSTSSTSTTINNNNSNNDNETQQENSNEPESIEELKRQLLQERQERQRLEASLQVTCDHFEVLSGLAYKKLRELWEEKIRWENISVELNGRLAAMGKNADGSSMTDGESNSAYFPI